MKDSSKRIDQYIQFGILHFLAYRLSKTRAHAQYLGLMRNGKLRFGNRKFSKPMHGVKLVIEVNNFLQFISDKMDQNDKSHSI
jgi:hypothetical protein